MMSSTCQGANHNLSSAIKRGKQGGALAQNVAKNNSKCRNLQNFGINKGAQPP